MYNFFIENDARKNILKKKIQRITYKWGKK